MVKTYFKDNDDNDINSDDNSDNDSVNDIDSEVDDYYSDDGDEIDNKSQKIDNNDYSNMAIGERLLLIENNNYYNAMNNIKHKLNNKSKKNSLNNNKSTDKLIDYTNNIKTVSKRDKNAPVVMRSDKQVSIIRKQPLITDNTKFNDPRFSNISNNKIDYNKLYKNYSFINDIQSNEIEQLQNKIKKSKDDEIKQELKNELIQLKQQMLERDRGIKVKHRIQQTYNEERKKVKEGKKPFFLKKSAIKELAMEERYKELVKDGKLNNFLAKKRKRNASKDHKKVPLRRNITE